MMKHMLWAMFMMVMVWGAPSLQASTQADFSLVTDLGTSARMIGLGRIEGFDTSAASVFENPAALAYVGESSISLFRTNLVNEFHYNNMAIAIEIPFGKLGFGYMEMVSYDLYSTATANIEGGERFIVVDSFDYKNQVYKFSYQWDVFDDLFIGVTYSFYQLAFEKVRGEGANLDLGVIYQGANFRISSMLKHLVPGSQVVYDNGAKEYLPFMAMLGVEYNVSHDLGVYAQYKGRYQNTTDGRDMYHLGAYGVRYNPDFVPYLTLFTGYRNDLVLDDIRSNMTLGLELSMYGFRAAYAFEKSDVPGFDNKNYFSIAINY